MSTTQNHMSVKKIMDAFAEVSLGNGVSLREADVIDNYGTVNEKAAAREQDELDVWQRIPDEDIENYSSALCFMDDEGLRFHLPAYMRFTLRRYRECETLSADATLCRLSDPELIKGLLAYLTEQQIDAIKTFLNTCVEIGDEWLDVTDVRLALCQWNGDERAADELHALQLAHLTAAKRIAEKFSGLASELRQKCMGGDLSEDELGEVLGLMQEATGKGGLRG